MSSKNNAEELSNEVKSSRTSETRLLEILEEHEDCFMGDRCEICDFLEDNDSTTLYLEMCGNPRLSQALQRKILEIDDACGYEYTNLIHYILVMNPQVVDEVKEYVLSSWLWMYQEAEPSDPEEWLFYLLRPISINPRFSQAELESLIDSVNEELDLKAGWEKSI